MDRSVPGPKPSLRFLFGASPDAVGDNARCAAFGADGAAEMRSPVGTVGEDLAGMVGQRRRTGMSVVHIGRGDRNLLDQRRVRIRADMDLEPVDHPPAFVLDPAPSSSLADAMIVTSTSVPILTVTAFALS